MIAELLFTNDAQPHPAYVVDCLGNLVQCRLESFREGELIPGSESLVSTAAERGSRKPWTITVEDVEARMSSVETLVPGLIAVYPNLAVPKSVFPFAPKVHCDEPDVRILEAIDLVTKLGEQDAGPVVLELGKIGVFKIPRMTSFNAAIHDPAEGAILGDEVETLADGWYSHMKIFRKAVVR